MQYRKKVKALQQAKRRKKNRMTTRKNIMKSLQARNLLLEKNINILNSISGPNKEILKRQVSKNRKRVPKIYSPELRKFALTIHYYSPKAYQYVREVFDTYVCRIQKHYIASNTKHPLLCALMVDEMAIRRHLEYDGTKMTGYVNIATGIEGDDLTLAKDALVFMICLALAHEAGVRVVSLTFDGTSTNIAIHQTWVVSLAMQEMHLELKAHDRGNCLPLEEISILHCSLLTTEQRINLSTIGCRLENTTDSMQIEDPSDNIYLQSIQELTDFSKTVVVYIAGFVIKHLYKTIKCKQCLGILVDSSNKLNYHLIAIKNRGGLLFPSSDVTDICMNSKKCVKQALAESGGKFLLKKFTSAYLSLSVLNYYLDKEIFLSLNEDIFDQPPMENYITLLIKAISKKYIDIRLHYIAKKAIDQSEILPKGFMRQRDRGPRSPADVSQEIPKADFRIAKKRLRNGRGDPVRFDLFPLRRSWPDRLGIRESSSPKSSPPSLRIRSFVFGRFSPSASGPGIPSTLGRGHRTEAAKRRKKCGGQFSQKTPPSVPKVRFSVCLSALYESIFRQAGMEESCRKL
ncbi:hypothetical protein ILUMI_10903 [Ignelater luminosus]|uniref:Uncharacterized protein n=1 Tax=Ignelater luminosus TaxID=2038154 RepID=A0A8K0D638_IGNLU|nr:hypothetical protein ILUMI_10903 [Ignelater luminosus]